MTKKGRATSLKVTGWWLLGTGLGFLALLGFMFWLLYQWVGFEKTATTDGATLAAGVLAVIGTLLTGSVTFVGLLLRLAQQAEAEARLQMEAAIQAVALMGDTTLDGNPVSNGQRAGAVYALMNLGQMPLAFVLLNQLWGEGKIDPSFGVLMVNALLEGDDDVLHRDASSTLNDHAETLWTSGGEPLWPPVASEWPPEMGRGTQYNLVLAMLKTLTSRPFADWGVDGTSWSIYALYDILTGPQTIPEVKRVAAMSLQSLMGSSRVSAMAGHITLVSGEQVTFREIASLAAEILPSDPHVGFIVQLRRAAVAFEQHVANG